VKLKRTAADDASRLERHIYPKLGDKPVASITLDDCLEVMRALPKSASRSRVHVAGTIARLLKLACFPLRIIERSPLPEGFAPRRPARKAMAWLWPDEDRRLLACIRVPLEYRMLWGFLSREGTRASEARALTWAALDLKRGMLKLDRNKTDDPRSWALDGGVHAALAWWRAQRADESMDQLVFRRPDGTPHEKTELAPLLRSHLELVGLKNERPELFTTTDERQRIRVHDLRGTFVTIALANGKSEAWIADRTGHRSSAMIAKYKRTARSFQELGLGALAAMSAAIPEGSVDTEVDIGPLNNEAKPMKPFNNSAASPTGFEPVLQP
jgi:integrase